MTLTRAAAEDFIAHASGRAHREDERLGRSGGPAGNARLTAWTGLILLLLFLVELITLVNVRSMIGWHVVVGVLLIPPALVKTASTGWRMVRYYTGNRSYRQAGPPPLLLRLLGPVVVASTLAVLASGVALILISPEAARQGIAGSPVSTVNIHKGLFAIWIVATGIHTLGRLVPALQLTVSRAASKARVPGRAGRLATVGMAAIVAVLAATLTLSVIGPWRASSAFEHHDRFHSRER